MSEEFIPLSELREGDEGIIHVLSGGRELSIRLAALGIALNMRIKVLRSRGDMRIIQAADTRVALGGGKRKGSSFNGPNLCSAKPERKTAKKENFWSCSLASPMWASPRFLIF